jgi:hypothetical protein
MATPKMRLLRGESRRITVDMGSGALSAGDPFKYGSGLAVAATDGARIDGVMVDDGAANATDQRAELLVDGQVWSFTCSSLTAVQGTDLAAAGSGLLDGGTSTNPSIGHVVDANVGSTATTGRLVVERGSIA